MQVDIWSDIVCPFCYIGKRHFEAALAELGAKAQVEVRWHSFELDSQAPARDPRPISEILAAKYGQSLEQIAAMQQRVISMGEQAGLKLRLNDTKRINSFLAHQLIHLAADHQLQDLAVERLMRAYFCETEDLSSPETLTRLLQEVGLPAETVQKALASADYADAVRQDQLMARELEITGVPFFLFDGTYAVSGAQPVSVFVQVLERLMAVAG